MLGDDQKISRRLGLAGMADWKILYALVEPLFPGPLAGIAVGESWLCVNFTRFSSTHSKGLLGFLQFLHATSAC
jgi:hypothetical protein